MWLAGAAIGGFGGTRVPETVNEAVTCSAQPRLPKIMLGSSGASRRGATWGLLYPAKIQSPGGPQSPGGLLWALGRAQFQAILDIHREHQHTRQQHHCANRALPLSINISPKILPRTPQLMKQLWEPEMRDPGPRPPHQAGLARETGRCQRFDLLFCPRFEPQPTSSASPG